MIKVAVTDKMFRWAEKRCGTFSDSSRPNAVTSQRRRVLTGFLCEAAFWATYRECQYHDAIDYDFILGSTKIDVKGKLCKHNPEKSALNFFINDTYIDKPFEGVYVFAFVSEDFKTVWLVGWETFHKFKDNAQFIGAGETYLQNGKEFQNKLDVWNLPVSKMRSMDIFGASVVGAPARN